MLAYAGIGSLIARRLPGNSIGWLLCLVGLLVGGSLFTEQYALMGLATHPGSMPEVKHIGALSGGLAVLAVILLIILVLVFPDGRLLSRRWRPVLWGTYVALAGGAAQQLQGGTTISGGLTMLFRAQTTTKMGSGVQGISDRLAALAGTVEIASSPGAGTRLTGRVPAIGR